MSKEYKFDSLLISKFVSEEYLRNSSVKHLYGTLISRALEVYEYNEELLKDEIRDRNLATLLDIYLDSESRLGSLAFLFSTA